MFALTVILILVSLLQGPSSAATKLATNAVAELEQRYIAALLKKDADEFEELLADDLLHVGFEGQIAKKTEYMSFFNTGAWRYTKYEPANVSVKIVGDVAIVIGRIDRTIVINEKEISGSFAFTHVWTYRGNRWRLTSSHVTNVANPK